MNYEEFEKKIKPLMDVIKVLCRENNIEFLAEFKLNNTGELYNCITKDMILDGATIMSQYQKWTLKQGK